MPKEYPTATSGGGRGPAISAGGRVYTPSEISNIQAHAEYIKNNPSQFERDPEFHSSRMKNDLEYQNNQSRVQYVKKAMNDIQKQNVQGTQAGHAITNDSNHTRTVK